MKKQLTIQAGFFRLICALALALSAFGQLFPALPVQADPGLTITPLTWNIVGLDSNNVFVGPNNFPVGARVCNTDTLASATGVASNFHWVTTDPHPFINSRPGSNLSYSGVTLAPAGTAGACRDFYYEIEITRDSDAYNQTRRYYITAESAQVSPPVSTPTPREIFVEHLISQSRNYVTDVLLDSVSIFPGRTMNLQVGGTYNITLVGSTAPGGYNQLESFINLPNTIFRVNYVTSTYGTSNLTPPYDMLYADSCGWDNDPRSPTYRSCVVSDGKTGAAVTNTFNITVISGGGTTQALNSLLYDFSGSSFHYNSDFSEETRYFSITNQVSFSKAFSPVSITPGGTSTLTFTLHNSSTTSPARQVSFSDTLPTSPAQMRVANPTGASTTGCGSPTFAPAANDTVLTFANGTIEAGGTCTISVDVTSPAVGSYPNLSGPLYVEGVNTGQTANAVLNVATNIPGTGCTGQTIASFSTWGTDGITYFATNPQSDATSIVTATSLASAGLTPKIETTAQYGNPTPGWSASGWPLVRPATTANTYFEFVVDTSNYDSNSVKLRFDALYKNPNGPQNLDVYTSTDQSTWNLIGAPITVTPSWATYTPTATGYTTNPNGNTWFRIYGYNAKNPNTGSDLVLDNVIFTGCSQPTIIKQFSPNPVMVNTTSQITFTLNNPNSTPLTGVAFSDALPSGLLIANPPSAGTTNCGSPSLTANAGAATISFSGGTLAASTPCTIRVNVTPGSVGALHNVTGYISSTETGATTNYGSDILYVASLNPIFSKKFAPNPINPGQTTALTFTITNPNSVLLTGVNFTDPLPSAPAQITVANPAGESTSGCGTPVFTPAPSESSLSFTGGSIVAGGTCTITVNVTAPVAGEYLNTSSVLGTSIPAITAPAATDTLRVVAIQPAITLLKQVSTSLTGPWTSFIRVTPGTPIYYRLTVENTGDVDLTNVSISDPTLDIFSCPLITPFTLTTSSPIASCIVGPVSAVLGDVQNTATARGTYGGNTYTSSSTAEYVAAIIEGTSSLSLTKQISTSPVGPWVPSITGIAGGTPLYYKFTLVNTGNTTLNTLSINDPLVDASGCALIDPLLSGRVTVCVVGPVSASSTPGTHTNTATASSVTPSVTSNPSSATYSIGLFSISGTVWQDYNQNGVIDGGEGPLFNVLLRLYLDVDNNGSIGPGDILLGNQYTTASGTYNFNDLPGGNYLVMVGGGVAGYLYSPLSGLDPRDITLASSSTGNNFGYYLDPTAVTLVKFSAGLHSPLSVGIEWTTGAEIDIAGFNLLRRQEFSSKWDKVNPSLIPARSIGSLVGSTYLFIDQSARPGIKYHYRLEEVGTKHPASIVEELEFIYFTSFLPLTSH